jgi:hypothetical protein
VVAAVVLFYPNAAFWTRFGRPNDRGIALRILLLSPRDGVRPEFVGLACFPPVPSHRAALMPCALLDPTFIVVTCHEVAVALVVDLPEITGGVAAPEEVFLAGKFGHSNKTVIP